MIFSVAQSDFHTDFTTFFSENFAGNLRPCLDHLLKAAEKLGSSPWQQLFSRGDKFGSQGGSYMLVTAQRWKVGRVGYICGNMLLANLETANETAKTFQTPMGSVTSSTSFYGERCWYTGHWWNCWYDLGPLSVLPTSVANKWPLAASITACITGFGTSLAVATAKDLAYFGNRTEPRNSWRDHFWGPCCVLGGWGVQCLKMPRQEKTVTKNNGRE